MTPTGHDRALRATVVRLVAQGFSNHQIATRVHLAESSTAHFVSSLMKASAASNRAHLVTRALCLGWVTLSYVYGDVGAETIMLSEFQR